MRTDHRGVAAGARSSEGGGQGCPPETTAAADRCAAVSAAVWHQRVPVEVKVNCDGSGPFRISSLPLTWRE